ncbi:A24 family peptidase [Herminiimonas glaciei]
MIVFTAFLCVAVIVYDVLFRRVPNGLLLLFLLAHTACMIVAGHGIGGIDVWRSVTGLTLGLIVFVPLYVWRVMGAGDVKFLAIIGALLGLKGLFVVWLIASVLAGLHALVFHVLVVWESAIPFRLNRIMQQIADGEMYKRMVSARQGRKGTPYAAYLAIALIYSLGKAWGG